MGMSEYEAAVTYIQRHQELQNFVGARSLVVVDAAERTLGVRFPPTYRRFLLEYGAGSFGADDYYGVIDDDFNNSSVPDTVWATLTTRQQVAMPSAYVEIYGVGDGEIFCLDLSTVHGDGESPVIAFWPSFPATAQTGEVIAENFGSFLLDRVQRQINRRTTTRNTEMSL